MAPSIRRLGPGDESILAMLARDDADFDLADRSTPSQPLDPDAARRYLQNPAVLHWIALDHETVVGFLYCVLVPLRSDDGQELLLYEIGVRAAWRRQGVGRALLAEMERWMRDHAVAEAWVLADNEAAVAFYRACGFAAQDDQPLYLTRRIIAAYSSAAKGDD